MTHTELIAALEAAEGPSQELDGRIWCAANGLEFYMWDGAGVVWLENGSIRHHPRDRVKPFTESIDAALSFTPEGWSWAINSLLPGGSVYSKHHTAEANLSQINPEFLRDDRTDRTRPYKRHERTCGATPAIALCIANFRALEQIDD